jgi:hypothetical protein
MKKYVLSLLASLSLGPFALAEESALLQLKQGEGFTLCAQVNSDGKFHGIVTDVDADHRVRSVAEYNNGERSGRYMGFSANGHLIVSGQYDRGQAVGSWMTYDEDGKMVERQTLPLLKPGEVPVRSGPHPVGDIQK